MKVILVLSDSLNRHYLPTYGNEDTIAPNIERFARRSVMFDNHWIGSAPCMPARRDMLTGRLQLPRTRSGAVSSPSTFPSRTCCRIEAGVFCHMETDHYHYFHVGGENYHMPFNSWRFHRGQEWDTYVSRVGSPGGAGASGQVEGRSTRRTRRPSRPRPTFRRQRTFQGAIDWLQGQRGCGQLFAVARGLRSARAVRLPAGVSGSVRRTIGTARSTTGAATRRSMRTALPHATCASSMRRP